MKNLHRKFVELGRQRHRLLNEMLAILPEIYESGVWRKYAKTIVEYAGKFGGISKSAVLKRLRLEKHLTDKPALKEAIKTAGVNKVAMVAAIATPQTDKAFADKVENMSKSAIETLSRELRAKADPTIVSPCGALAVRVKVELDEELSFLFMKLKQRWGMNNKEVMRLLLNNAVATEFPEKEVSIKAMRMQTAKKVNVITGDNSPKPKKYINVYKQRVTLSETGGRCSYPGCNKPAVNFHHADRWSITKNHNNIRPLCKEHHEFPHNGLIENETSGDWRLNLNGELKTEADVLYRKYRQEALL